MSKAPAVITSSVNPDRIPISESEVTQFLNNSLTDLASVNNTIESLLQILKKKSSKFKYIVNATTFSIDTDSYSNTKINSTFGSLWDEKDDGILNIRLQLNDTNYAIFNIIFISI